MTDLGRGLDRDRAGDVLQQPSVDRHVLPVDRLRPDPQGPNSRPARAMIPVVGGGQFWLDPATYLDDVREEVPLYDELQEVVAEATVGIDVGSILELGVGTGETARRVLARHPGARLVGVDGSPEMVEAARRMLPDADLRVGHLEHELPEGEFDLVVSALAVHHLTGPAKADLFRRVADRLRSGGRFVLGDVVVPEDPADAVIPLEAGVDLPDRLDDQLGWLRNAGFRPVVMWSRQDLAIVAADR